MPLTPPGAAPLSRHHAGRRHRLFNRFLDAPSISGIRRIVAAVKEHPRHTAWLDQSSDHGMMQSHHRGNLLVSHRLRRDAYGFPPCRIIRRFGIGVLRRSDGILVTAVIGALPTSRLGQPIRSTIFRAGRLAAPSTLVNHLFGLSDAASKATGKVARMGPIGRFVPSAPMSPPSASRSLFPPTPPADAALCPATQPLGRSPNPHRQVARPAAEARQPGNASLRATVETPRRAPPEHRSPPRADTRRVRTTSGTSRRSASARRITACLTLPSRH